MTPSSRQRLGDAEDLWKSGDFVGAWFIIEDLPAVDWAHPDAQDLRLRLCIALGDWEVGDDLVMVLQEAVEPTHQITCAEYGIARARNRIHKGDPEKAREWLSRATRWWRPIEAIIEEEDDFLELE